MVASEIRGLGPELSDTGRSAPSVDEKALAFERQYDPYGLLRAMDAAQKKPPFGTRVWARLRLLCLSFVSLLPFLLLVGLPVIAVLDFPNPPATVLAILFWGWAIGFALHETRMLKSNRSPLETGSNASKPGSVIVIGAGPVGLVVAKECREQGLEVKCFERQPGVGGVFRYTEEFDGGVWKSCTLTSSPWVTAFSDFPPESDSCKHLHHSGYQEYLEKYVEHFGLGPSLHLRHTVQKAVAQPDGSWVVTVTNDATGEEENHTADRLVVCSGLNIQPKSIRLPGADGFEGEIRHVAKYKNPEGCEGKRVVVVGSGESGVDIAADVSRVAKEAFLSIRRGKFIIPRINPLNGIANDYDTNRLRYSSPIGVRNWFMTFRRRLCMKLGVATKEAAFRAQMLEQSEAGPMSQTVTKNDDFIAPACAGRLKIRKQVVSFDKDAVVFADGVRQPADLVLFAHGYNPTFPFLMLPDGVGQRHPGLLYLRMFMPEVGDRLAFCGFARPAIGAIPPTGELQARLFALIAAGKLALPSQRAMRGAIVEQVRESAETFPEQVQPNVVISWIRYLDRIATLVGCRPNPRKLLLRPGLFWKVLTGPATTASYRLHGPGATPLAEKSMAGLPRMHELSELMILVGLHFWVWPVAMLHTHAAWKSHNTFV